MRTVLDCNNFWSPSGGGVRRYHLEKLAYFESQSELNYVFVMPDERTYTERRSQFVTIEHVKAVPQPGAGEYRLLLSPRALRKVICDHRADVVEVGSPYVLPDVVHRAVRGLQNSPALVGFWHADYPRTYIGRFFGKIRPSFEAPAEDIAWRWARRTYGRFDAIFVASRWIGERMIARGLDRLFFTPLGVDCERFAPQHRDETLRAKLQAGDPHRKIIFFPHRLQEEKGVRNLIAAYELLCERGIEPTLVFAGDGPDRAAVEAVTARHEHIHYIGYLKDPSDMGRYYASADLSVSLSAFETFGLSTAEAMASGLAIVAANRGGAAELVEDSGCGLTVPYGDSRALADAMATLFADTNLEDRGRRGRDFVEKLTWRATFDRQVAAYREIVAARKNGTAIAPGFHGLDVKSGAHTPRCGEIGASVD